MIRHLLLLLAASCALASAHAGDFNFEAYKPVSLTSVAERQKYQASDYLIEAGNTKYTVVGIYTGRHREIDAKTKELIHRWVKSLRHPKEYESLFDNEVEIESDGKKFWLPIQNPMVQSFASEFREGSAVKLYIMLIGGTKDRMVFAINEFQNQ